MMSACVSALLSAIAYLLHSRNRSAARTFVSGAVLAFTCSLAMAVTVLLTPELPLDTYLSHVLDLTLGSQYLVG
jgi:hypothetical protein